ncbi:MAG: hypothetical protein PVJ67_01825 [Candidatus Pacearchaeota archaeon]
MPDSKYFRPEPIDVPQREEDNYVEKETPSDKLFLDEDPKVNEVLRFGELNIRRDY